jgi:hypothetical protein
LAWGRSGSSMPYWTSSSESASSISPPLSSSSSCPSPFPSLPLSLPSTASRAHTGLSMSLLHYATLYLLLMRNRASANPQTCDTRCRLWRAVNSLLKWGQAFYGSASQRRDFPRSRALWGSWSEGARVKVEGGWIWGCGSGQALWD